MAQETEAREAEPIAWRERGYNQFKTGKPGPWRYFDGPTKPRVNDPDCCDIEPLYAAASPSEGTVEGLMKALQLAVRQNSHDMLMTGDELRQCEAAIRDYAKTLNGEQSNG